MVRAGVYIKQRVLYHATQGLNASAISRELVEEGICYSRTAVWAFLRKFRETHNVARRPGSGRTTRVTQRAKDLIETQMQ